MKPLTTATALAVIACAASGAAQPRAVPHPLPRPVVVRSPAATPAEEDRSLRAALGLEGVLHLLRSPADRDVARGIERLAAMDGPEAFTLLLRTAAPTPGAVADGVTGCARRGPMALLGIVRALAPAVDREPARRALLEIVDAPAAQLDAPPAGANADADAQPERAGRVLLARQEAALALARSGSTAAEEKLVDTARREGPGEGAAVAALAAFPPASPAVLGGVTLTTRSMIGLAAAIGDLRTLDGLLGILKASDPELRAAALGALGEAGDARVLDAARAATRDPSAKVRVAAAEALVRVGVGDAAGAVEALVGDDATALEGLRLAAQVQGEGVTRAVAARAAVASDLTMRSAALEALGRQTSPAAVAALSELGRDPGLRGDAAAALARSPSPVAMGALEAMATRTEDRRVAARAYFVRRMARDVRSRALDALLASLASSPDARDRAVGVEALVALGERPLEAGLSDLDPRVRAAAAMGSAAHLDARSSAMLLARMAVEPDPATRAVLALGLLRGSDRTTLAASLLSDRVRAGGADAPLEALALARRFAGEAGSEVPALLASRDPVLRASVARGLGSSEAPSAAGLLAQAYPYEVDAMVRRATVEALGSRAGSIGPAGLQALTLAAALDPDGSVRALAARAIHGGASTRPPSATDVAWVRLVPAEGAALPRAATGALVDAEGVAWPVAFDDEGFAIEPGIPQGPYRLRLAPRMPSYSSPVP